MSARGVTLMGNREGVSDAVLLAAQTLARAHGGYGEGDAEHWANFSHEATLVVDALRTGLIERLKIMEQVFGPPKDPPYLLSRVTAYLTTEPPAPVIVD